MKNKSFKSFITFMYWLLRIGFWFHLTIVSFLLLLNYFTYDSKAGLYFTVRGSVHAYDANWKPVKGEVLDSIGSKSIFFLNGQRIGFMRIDYTDLSKAFTIQNIAWTLADILPLLLWLFITYQLMKVLQSLKNESIFIDMNIKRIKFIGWFVILIPFIEVARDQLFLLILRQHLKIPGFVLFSNFNYLPDFSLLGGMNNNIFPKVILGLIIIVIVQIFKTGLELQKEKDLTI